MDLLSRQLLAWGMLPPYTAVSIPEALTIHQQKNDVNLIILDADLPEVSELTPQHPLAKAPIVLLSPRRQREIPIQFSFAAFISKPAKPSQLFRAVSGVFNMNKPQQASASNKPVDFNETMGSELPLRILLAEDNLINQKVVQRILSKLGYRADIAGAGIEVLTALKQQPYDVVFMDI